MPQGTLGTAVSPTLPEGQGLIAIFFDIVSIWALSLFAVKTQGFALWNQATQVGSVAN